jgi:hypothetical protein
MQKFTRNLTREIEIGGERIAVTMDATGLQFRTVGTRRPPLTVDWVGVVCAAAHPASGTDQIAEAVQALKKGGEKTPAAPAAADTETTPAHVEAAPAAANHAPVHAAPAAAVHAHSDGHSGTHPAGTLV